MVLTKKICSLFVGTCAVTATGAVVSCLTRSHEAPKEVKKYDANDGTPEVDVSGGSL